MNFEKRELSPPPPPAPPPRFYPLPGKRSLEPRAWGNDNPDKLLNASNLSGGISRNNIPYLKSTNASTNPADFLYTGCLSQLCPTYLYFSKKKKKNIPQEER